MKLGLYMATQWRQGADLGPELANLIEQVRAARASGLASLMVGQHFVSSPLQMFQAMPLLARLAAEAEGMRLGPGLLLLPLLNPVVVAEETATPDWLCDGNAILGLGPGYRPEEFASIRIPFKERLPRFVAGVRSEGGQARRWRRCASRWLSSTKPMRAGAAPQASCRPSGSARTSTLSPPTASSSARRARWWI